MPVTPAERGALILTIDTGRTTTAQLALILATRRAETDEDATATDAEILAHVRNTLTLPGESAPGGHPVTDDGSDYAAALIAFLSPANADEILATIEQLHQQVWAAAPVLVVETVTDDGETYLALRCPVCGQLVTDSYGDLHAVDVSTRWSIAETDDDHQQMSVSRGEDDYSSTLYYLHTTGEPHVVVPPEDWTESWS